MNEFKFRSSQTLGALCAMVAFGVHCRYKGKPVESFKQESDML